MVRVQPEKPRDTPADQIMEPQYQPFRSSDQSSVNEEPKITIQSGMKRAVIFVLYGILVLLLLILLMVTGIKFSHLNKEIADIKNHLKGISHSGATSVLSSAFHVQAETTVQQVLLEELTPVRGTCSRGWVSFQRGCYLLSTNAVTWSRAEEQCKTQGGHLVVLNNVEELDYISKIIPIQHSYWIGLVERQHEGHWSWVDGTDYSSTPTFWDVGQPDNWDYVENGEDCGQLHASERRKRKLWNDADCQLNFRYICEKRA